MEDTATNRAILAAGGVDALSKRLKISKQAVHRWRHTGIPAARVLEVERATACQVSRYELRPDIYGKAPS